MNKTITTSQLRALGACKSQITLFDQLTGGRLEISENWAQARASQFYWSWAVEHLLSPIARAEYGRIREAALAEYMRIAAARADWAEYRRMVEAIWAEYMRIQACTFAALYDGDAL